MSSFEVGGCIVPPDVFGSSDQRKTTNAGTTCKRKDTAPRRKRLVDWLPRDLATILIPAGNSMSFAIVGLS